MSIFSRYSKSKVGLRFNGGFTLIELLVVLGIVMLISAILLVNNSRFNSAILLRSLAYQIGLTMRQAQLYGVAVRETSPGGGNFSAAYGIYLDNTGESLLNVQNGSYRLFADLNVNGLFDDGGASVLDTFKVGNRFSITNMCVVDASVVTHCATDGSNPVVWLSISFRRPDPEAVIYSNVCSLTPCKSASIQVGIPGGSTRSTSVSSTGLISVQGTAN